MKTYDPPFPPQPAPAEPDSTARVQQVVDALERIAERTGDLPDVKIVRRFLTTSTIQVFQAAVDDWVIRCFGNEIRNDVKERCYRFFEEATEFVQSLGMTRDECVALLDYVFDREAGEPVQELGGVMVTLAALCNAQNFDMLQVGELELCRIERLIDKIRQKHASKTMTSGSLPGTTTNNIPTDEQIDRGSE